MIALRGFYAVLDRDDEALARTLVGAGGARVLQVRVKPGDAGEVARIARMARRVCDERGAALVVDDRLDVALAVRADGVHLGQADLPLAEARVLAAGRLWIGVSTHDAGQVARAVDGGADYLGFGPIFATRSKANPDPVQGLAGLRAAVVAARGTPIVAIGGITPADASAVYAAGASAICAIASVNGAPDVAAAARSLGLHDT
ncbi:MAG TPA: thiamine phosphate synthase [Kofleriaceae bacterium]|nr:thiamine phosphate synthase [Kofleriaceae bacterium]